MKKIIYILSILSLMLLNACREDDVQGEANNKLHVTLEVKQLSTPTTTRAPIAAEEGEDQIGSLYLLFFAPDAAHNGTLIDYVKVNQITGMQATVDLSGTTGITASNAYNILAIANIFDNTYISQDRTSFTDVESWMQSWVGRSERRVTVAATALIAEAANTTASITPDRLLMSASIEKAVGKTDLNLLLIRNVVRFDVYNNSKEDYNLVSASIWNAYPTTSIWGGMATDFSPEAPRLERLYTLDNGSNFTEQDGQDGAGKLLADIVGGLYTFENQVAAPEQNDKLTTCLIIGLENRATGVTSYYRGNMHAEGNPQILTRNNVYRLTITGVTGAGYETEDMAYHGQGNDLSYLVNLWNMDDNGLIVQDENSIISLSTKTINIGRGGGQSNYPVFISSKLPNPEPLTIVSQLYDPDDRGITASINGNMIHVEAAPLADNQLERRGVVILSYGGLQTAVTIIQRLGARRFLNITLPDGGIPPFPAAANISSGLITVDASGPWSAQIYMDGFSFAEGKRVDKISSGDAMYVSNNKFRIYTNSINPESAMRQGFVVVTLDSDPENHSSLVRIAQKPVTAIRINPDQNIVYFNIDGSLFVPLPPATSTNTFNILPNLLTAQDGESEYLPEWKAEILQTGAYDDRAMFQITTQQHDPNTPGNNILTVNATGANYTGHRGTATLHISLVDDPGTFAEIQLSQRSFQWDVPHTPANIPGTGGTTPELKVGISTQATGLHYTVAIESFDPISIYGVGANKHRAYLIDGDDPTATAYSSLQPNDIAVGFKVGFPPLSMALIDQSPTVTVAITLVETGETKTFTVSQSPFQVRPVNAVDIGGNAHGNLATGGNNPSFRANAWDGTYQENLAQFLMNNDYFSPTGTVKTLNDPGIAKWADTGGATTVWQVIQNDVSFVNYVRPSVNTWANGTVWDWMRSDSGLTLIASESNQAQGATDYSSSYIPGQLGLQGGGGYVNVGNTADWTVAGGFQINPDDSNPVIDYLVHSGPFGEVEGWQNLRIGNGGINGYTVVSSIAPALGTDAVPVVQMVSNDPNCAPGQLITELIIDPSLNLILKNDSEFFYDDPAYYTAPEEKPRLIFTLNLVAFMVNTAQYGSIFTNQFWDNPIDIKTMPQPQP